MLQAGGPQAYTHIGHSNGSKGRHTRPYGNLTAIYNQVEAWHEWQTGQDRQSGAISPGTVDLTVIFPPVDVMQVLPRGVHAVLPLTSPLEVFCTISTVFVCMDSVRGPHQTLSKN